MTVSCSALPARGSSAEDLLAFHLRSAGHAFEYEAAQRLGWTVYRCDPQMIRSGRALQTITMLLGKRDG